MTHQKPPAAPPYDGPAPSQRLPLPVSHLPPALASGPALCGPFRHGLPSGRSWWEVGADDGALRLVTLDDDKGPAARVIAAAVPWVIGQSRDLETGAELVTLTWRAPGGGAWHEATVGRATVADPRALATLADRGLPVTAGPMARGLVDWLHDCIIDGAHLARRGGASLAAAHVGWVGPDNAPAGWVAVPGWRDVSEVYDDDDGEGGGVYRQGDTLPAHVAGSGWIASARGAAPVKLAAPGGLEVLARAMAPRGCPDAFMRSLRQASPALLVAVGASLASALLRPLGLSGFLLDLSGATSGGKTSALRVAAAVWGDPDQLVRTWRDSDAYLYRAAAFLGSVPIFLDDTKTENDPRRVASTIYSLTSGVERGRGTADGGVQATRTWRSVGLLTGEQRLTSFSSDAGTRARVLSVWGQVFRCAGDAEDAVEAARAHHGHLGPAYVAQWFRADATDDDGECGNAGILRAVFRTNAREFGADIDDGNVNAAIAARLRLPAAAVMTALVTAQGAGLLPPDLDLEPARELLRRAVLEGAADADQPLAALLAVESERAQHPDRWAPSAAAADLTAGQTPSAGWAGVYSEGKRAACWLPNVLDAALTRAGFRPAETLARWADRGWLVRDAQGKNPRIGLSGSRPRLVVVKLAHLDG